MKGFEDVKPLSAGTGDTSGLTGGKKKDKSHPTEGGDETSHFFDCHFLNFLIPRGIAKSRPPKMIKIMGKILPKSNLDSGESLVFEAVAPKTAGVISLTAVESKDRLSS